MLERQWFLNNFLCIGLDSEYGKIPEEVHCHKYNNSEEENIGESMVKFNRLIVDVTSNLVCAYKINSAFYEAYGKVGIKALAKTFKYIRQEAPEVPIILDAKRADIGNTNNGYVKFAFDYLGADAITVNPYLGAEALKPFLDLPHKGIFVLCRTSNSGAGEFQDLLVDGQPLYKQVARHVADEWDKYGNCALVVGATYPDELIAVRSLVGDMPILIPGIGAQGGDLEKTVTAGKNSQGTGMIINSSRGIIFAPSDDGDFEAAAQREAQKLHDLINQYRG